MKRKLYFNIVTIGDLQLLNIDTIKCSKCGERKPLAEISEVKGKVYMYKYNEPTRIKPSKKIIAVKAMCAECNK